MFAAFGFLTTLLFVAIALFHYTLLCLAVGAVAEHWGQKGMAMFLMSIFLTPVVGGIFVLAAGRKR